MLTRPLLKTRRHGHYVGSNGMPSVITGSLTLKEITAALFTSVISSIVIRRICTCHPVVSLKSLFLPSLPSTKLFRKLIVYVLCTIPVSHTYVLALSRKYIIQRETTEHGFQKGSIYLSFIRLLCSELLKQWQNNTHTLVIRVCIYIKICVSSIPQHAVCTLHNTPYVHSTTRRMYTP